ncbi:MAG: response regulator [Oligoflexia bacterium]|nr:response regulator [Oligoflexia bacterium]
MIKKLELEHNNNSENGYDYSYLLDVIQVLSRAKLLDEVISTIKSATRKLISADGVTFVLRDDQFCFYVDEDAIGPLWKGQRFPLEMCISGWVMLHKKEAVIPDIYADKRIPADAYRSTFVKSLAMVPVRRQKPVAAIGVYWSSRHTASTEEIKKIQILANSASTAMENIHINNLLQAQMRELQQAIHSKDEFLQIVSHELRTPLSVILGWSNIISMQITRSENEQRNKLSLSSNADIKTGFESIEQSANSLKLIVEDLMDTAQIMSGKLKIKLETLHPEKLIEHAIKNFQVEINKKNISLKCSIETFVPPILGDTERMYQILSNLLSNAIKFTPRDGQIQITLSREGPMAKISVCDNGIGIDPQFLPFVFDRFRQADSSSKRQNSGLGLGLTIVKGLVEAHKGKISASSNGIGEGATFHLWLPLQEDNITQSQSDLLSQVAEGRLAAIKIMVLDDEVAIRHLLKTAFEWQGATVFTADKAETAISVILNEKFSPDIILCDLSMPYLDGFYFLRTIRKEKHGRLPVIAFSGFATEENRLKVKDAGFDGFVSKPVAPLELVETIAKTVSGLRAAGGHSSLCGRL